MDFTSEKISNDHDAQSIKLQGYVITLDLLAIRDLARLTWIGNFLDVSIIQIINPEMVMALLSPVLSNVNGHSSQLDDLV